MDGGDVDADLLEDAAMHHRHGAAAALAYFAQPRRPLEAAGIPVDAGMGDLVLELLERGADTVAQRLEPGSGLHLPVFHVSRQTCRYLWPFHSVPAASSDSPAPDGPARTKRLVFSGSDP